MPHASEQTASAGMPLRDHEVHLEALGVLVRIVTDGPAMTRALRAAWAACLVDDLRGRQPAVVLDGRVAMADSGGSLDGSIEILTQHVTGRAIGHHAGELLMLHACVLADPLTRQAIVMVGPSGVGKTTLARTLGKRWAYVTDETAAIDTDLSVLPYPKPLSLVRPGVGVKAQVAPSDLGLRVIEGPVEVRAVVLLSRVAGAADALVEEISTVPAIATLSEHVSYLARMPRPLTRLATLLHRTGGLRRITYSEWADVEPVVARLLDSRPVEGP
jgi:hypothetical protein